MEVDATEGSFIRLPLAQLEVAQPTVSFLKALPSQKLFLGEVSHNLPPHPGNYRCAVDVDFDGLTNGEN